MANNTRLLKLFSSTRIKQSEDDFSGRSRVVFVIYDFDSKRQIDVLENSFFKVVAMLNCVVFLKYATFFLLNLSDVSAFISSFISLSQNKY